MRDLEVIYNEVHSQCHKDNCQSVKSICIVSMETAVEEFKMDVVRKLGALSNNYEVINGVYLIQKHTLDTFTEELDNENISSHLQTKLDNDASIFKNYPSPVSFVDNIWHNAMRDIKSNQANLSLPLQKNKANSRCKYILSLCEMFCESEETKKYISEAMSYFNRLAQNYG